MCVNVCVDCCRMEGVIFVNRRLKHKKRLHESKARRKKCTYIKVNSKIKMQNGKKIERARAANSIKIMWWRKTLWMRWTDIWLTGSEQETENRREHFFFCSFQKAIFFLPTPFHFCNALHTHTRKPSLIHRFVSFLLRSASSQFFLVY